MSIKIQQIDGGPTIVSVHPSSERVASASGLLYSHTGTQTRYGITRSFVLSSFIKLTPENVLSPCAILRRKKTEPTVYYSDLRRPSRRFLSSSAWRYLWPLSFGPWVSL